jgi:hypothetical protein
MPRVRLRVSHVVLLVALLSGCRDSSRAPVIGEGYVAPSTLNLRRALGPREPSVAMVKHGERLEIIGRRRRFVKVRTASGVEGWTDGRLLFSPEQMAELQGLAEQARRLPSQGTATAFDTLNVHTHPNRQSPSFVQLPEGAHVDVVAHRLAPRVQFAPGTPQPELAASVPMDDWSLVRTPNGPAGWVLFRMLVMSIPDEVAQYAEGHRITSYFALGEVRDRDRVKQNWLWTTIARGLEPYQFDSIRVFVWSRQRHRYETAYIERNLRGYYPVQVHPGEGWPSFSLIVEEKDGQRYRRTYAFQGFRVRLTGKQPWNPPAEAAAPYSAEEESSAPAPRSKSWPARLWDKLRSLGGR